MTTLNVYDHECWFSYDDAEGFEPMDIWFTFDVTINGEWKPNHDFQAIIGLVDVADQLPQDDRAAIIALIDQLFAEYERGEAA